MKIKLSRLMEVFGALNELARVKMPVKAGYRVAKNIALIRPEVETYERERIKLAESLGKKSADGSRYDFEGENQEAFSTQIGELLAEEVELNLATLTPDELGSADIEPGLLMALDGVVLVEPKAA